MTAHATLERLRHALLIATLFAVLPVAGGPQRAWAQAGRGLHASATAAAEGGTWRAVVAGVSDYSHLQSLDYADDDAQAFYDYLVHRQGGKLDSANVVLLRDGAATQGAIINHLDRFLKDTEEGDRLLFYFAGHGDVMESGFGRGAYLVMPEAVKGAYSSPGMGLRMSEFPNFARQVSDRGGQMLIVLDACRSGKVADTKEGALQALSSFGERDNIVKLVSSQGDQLSWENAEWGGGHGVFTYHLLRALYGLADRLPQNNTLTFLEVQQFVVQEVVQATSAAGYEMQTPVGVASNLNAPLFGVEAEMLAEAEALEARGFPTLIASRGATAPRARLDSTAAVLLRRFRQALKAGRLLAAAPESPAAPHDTGPAPTDTASAWVLYETLQDVLDAEDPHQKHLLRRARGSLTVALQDAAQQTMVQYVHGVSDVPSSEAFAAAGRATRHALQLLPSDYFLLARVAASANFYEGYAIVRQREAARYDEAEALLRKALASDPDAAHVYTALSDLARYRRDFDAALQYAEEALVRAPRWEYAHVRRADVLEDMGRYREALDAYGVLIEMHPESRYALNNRGVLYFNLDRYAEAERDFEAARAIGEPDGRYLSNLAAVALEREHLTRAEELLADAAERFPDDAFVQNKLGDLYRALDQGENAARHYRRAAALSSNNPAPHAELGDLYRRSDVERAEAHFREAIRIDPAYVWAYDDLASIVAAREGEDAGERVLLDADRTLDRPAWTANQLGHFHEHRDRADEAERYYREAIRRNADYVWAYFNLADLLEVQGRLSEAQAQLTAATERFTGNPVPFTRLGAFHFRHERFEAAAEAYRRALTADSSYLPAVAGLAYVRSAAGSYARAAARFEQAAAQNPAKYRREDFARHLEAEAHDHERTEETAAAVAAWTSARRLTPERERPVRRLAQLHYRSGHPADALPLVDEALTRLEVHQQSALALVHTLRALVLLDLRQPTEALAALDAADRLRIHPDRRTRAIVLWAAGRRDEARALHQQAARQPAPLPYSSSTLSLERQIDP